MKFVPKFMYSKKIKKKVYLNFKQQISFGANNGKLILNFRNGNSGTKFWSCKLIDFLPFHCLFPVQ